jgi:acyl-coenzyme A synthetase/AMP-(fatty) acid ligase
VAAGREVPREPHVQRPDGGARAEEGTTRKYLTEYDISSLRALYLAGEPLDETTARWISDAIGKPVIDNYWQTETGWPILTIAGGIERMPTRLGSPGVPMYGFDVKLLDEQDRRGAR